MNTPDPTPDCTRPSTTGTCLESLASGWITASDLCPGCTRHMSWNWDHIYHPSRAEAIKHPAEDYAEVAACFGWNAP